MLRGRNIGRAFTPAEEEAQSGTSGRISYFCSHLGVRPPYCPKAL